MIEESPARKPPALHQRVAEAAEAVRARARHLKPRFGVVLGTGLGGFQRAVEVSASIPYAEIPWFPPLRAVSHQGLVTLGTISSRPVAVLEGRYHYYEGYTLEEVTFPIRVLRQMGVELLILSNVAGGLNPAYALGDLMVIDDHLNLMGVNPLIGPNDDRLGPRFPDMCEPYDRRAMELVEAVARREGIRCHRGVYAAMTGPCLETRAEYRFLRTIGADAIGMSTVPEVIVAAHAGLRSFGISCISDRCIPEELKPVVIEEIIKVAAQAEPKMSLLLRRLIETY